MKIPYLATDVARTNFLMNGDCSIAQRALTLASISSGSNFRVIDRWAPNVFNGGTWTMSRSTDIPGALSSYQGGSSMRFECTTADVSLLTSHMAAIYQTIEGQIFQALKSKFATMSFWVKTNKIGPYSVSFRNSSTVVNPNARSWVSPFTVIAPNTWEYKTVYVDFSEETTGVWDFSNAYGCIVEFNFHPGVNRQTATPNVWTTGDGGIDCLTGQNNLADTIGNYVQLTQLRLTAGEHQGFELAGGDFEGEVALCERYYEKSYPTDVNPGTLSASGAFLFTGPVSAIRRVSSPFKTRKRATPVVTVYATQTANNPGFVSRDVAGDTAIAFSLASDTAWGYEMTMPAGELRTYAQFTAEADINY